MLKINRRLIHTINYLFLKLFNINYSVILILLSIFIVNTSSAEQLHFVINGKAFHSNERQNNKYNERNFGAGLQYDFDNFDKYFVPFLNIGGFSDSNNNPSYYIGGGLAHRTKFRNRWKNFHIDAGMSAFIMTRLYPQATGEKSNSVIPGILPMISMGTESAALNIVYIPKIEITEESLWFIQLKLKTDVF